MDDSPSPPPTIQARPFEPVAVIGAGTIGRGVAECLCRAAIPVIVVDRSRTALDEAQREIARGLFYSGMFQPSPVKPAGRAEATWTTDLDAVREAGFVIENIPEDFVMKRAMFAELDRICRDDCVLAANTSAIPIGRLAAATARADRILGLHFMNPVPLTRIVELIVGARTSESTVAAATALLARIGKQWVVVRDSPGFVSNRISMLMINEAIRTAEEGIATVESIDELFRSGFAHKMGPLETADLIGLDTVLQTLEVLREELGDAKFQPSTLLRQLVDSGKLGRKSGAGLYDYTTDGLSNAGAAR